MQRYHLTPAQYEDMLHSQGGVCAICKRPPTYKRKFLSVDHDHTCCPGRTCCGKCVRGLICQPCNHMLGHANDSPVVLYEAIRYLINHAEAA